ncbi:hypothetical protein HG536_0E00990 [Torulaspora globosa]|uniref:Uncharacterized protein n=1 Tax=Torulaspora globosa TaxID=48254 RepID=A0A7G3ZI52_9SACH|nr:uncharacterized protein HG536_0E00990 [Torulaspora globosa]QLL33188.1 hypothetical protein HG536_0E00990 [Torulaspora globosa]
MNPKQFRLPKSFFGFLPLYLGVEIALGISILNKCSGAYGILALFTGHPLHFSQWLLYIWSIITLIICAQGLYQVHKPSVLTFSHIFVTFVIDTAVTCLFSVWFTAQWYSLEGNSGSTDKTKSSYSEDPVDYSTKISDQGASESFEYGVTIFITVLSLAAKLYFTFLMASFVQELLLHPRYMLDQDDVEQDLKNQSSWKRWWVKSQKICYNISKSMLV